MIGTKFYYYARVPNDKNKILQVEIVGETKTQWLVKGDDLYPTHVYKKNLRKVGDSSDELMPITEESAKAYLEARDYYRKKLLIARVANRNRYEIEHLTLAQLETVYAIISTPKDASND